MATGITLKQLARQEFFAALEAYKNALASGNSAEILVTSIQVHSAKGGVPKKLWPLVGQTFRENTRRNPEAAELAAKGYRRVSRASGIISRVDRPDWKEAMGGTHPDGMEWVNLLGKGAADQYRRCHSRDTKRVPLAVSEQIPSSCWDETSYIPNQETTP